jgi:hypothetical protein
MPQIMTSHQTALALQRMNEALADISVAIRATTSVDDIWFLWRQFAPLVMTTVDLQDRMASKCKRLQVKD